MCGKVKLKYCKHFKKNCISCHVTRLSYSMCGEIHSQYMSSICDLNWMLDSELGETSACISDFVGISLKTLGKNGIRLCEFGSHFLECLLVTLLTNAGSLQLCVCFICRHCLYRAHRYCSSYIELSLCAIIATFDKTANKSGPIIEDALQATSDINMKRCLNIIYGGSSRCMCMVHVEKHLIQAQIMLAQSSVF